MGPYPGDSLERLQATQREILSVIDDLCERNGIEWFADGGTCLGAMRHQGFIPWDDDIDIAMPYEDWLRFVELAASELPEGYSLHTYRNTPGMTAFWAKIYKDGTRFIDHEMIESHVEQGIFVDVMPYCVLEADEKRAARQRQRASVLQRISYLTRLKHPKIPWNFKNKEFWRRACLVGHYVVRFVPVRFLAWLFWRTWRCKEPGDLCVNANYAANDPIRREVLLPTKRVPFDDITIRVPADAVEYLNHLYWKWHELPPEDDRFRHAPEILDFGDGVNVIS